MHDTPAGTGAAPGPSAIPPLRWPAPGVEAIHGAAWPPITLLASGSAVLAGSVLSSIATPQPFWSTGPYGTSWWVPLAAALLGLALVIRGMERLARMLLGAALAARRGYSWRLVAWTATDRTRDAGFLLQGLRHYATLGERERRWMLNARVVTAATYGIALLWVPLALAAGVLLASRGLIAGTATLLLFVLAPAASLLAIGLACSLLDGMATGRAWQGWLRHGRDADTLPTEAVLWQAELEKRLATTAHTVYAPATAPLRGVGWGLALLAVLLPLPIATVALASAVGPIVSQSDVTPAGWMAKRLARVAVLQPYAVPVDAGITPEQAGEALNALSFAGTAGPTGQPLQRAPVRLYDAPLFAVEPSASLAPAVPERIGRTLFARLATLTPEERQYLRAISSHPALDELRVVARAAEADIGGARWNLERARHAPLHELPTPQAVRLREAMGSHIAGAVLLAAEGRTAAAEQRLREVISFGLLVAREGPTLMDMLIGTSIAEEAGTALEAFYEATGQQRQAESIRLARAGVDALDRTSKALRMARWEYEPRDLMAAVENELLPRGMRWDRLMNVQLVAGCLNPHSAVFGAGAEYREWLERARASLVRFPSDEALFAATMNGLGTTQQTRRNDVVKRLVGLTLRRDDAPGSCARVLGTIATLN